jgi:putative ABC transport system permease protein
MFDYDKWQEILATVKKNKLRTFLTMFGVFWGIFMLMLLLGSGKGLENGVTKNFGGWATNSGFVWTNKTTMAYQGMQPGRFIRFTNEDKEAIEQQVEGLGVIAPRNNAGGWRGGNNVSRKTKTGAFTINGDYPEYQQVQIVDVYSGRHINAKDIADKRKIAVIGESVVNILFEKDENPIGEYILINGVFFQVVGTFKSLRGGEQGNHDTQSIYVPFTTFQQAFNIGNRIGWFAFTAQPGVDVSLVEDGIKKVLRERHKVHPEDVNALGSENLQKEFGQITGLFTGISIFVWIVGTGTLLAGVIGVSNIMLIIVKERTKEIGVRKALGATPLSIISLILQESIIITAFAGYAGIFFGTLIIETIGYFIRQQPGGSTEMFGPPEVSFGIALAALLTLVFFGALAGLVPARKAAKISPIEAIRID